MGAMLRLGARDRSSFLLKKLGLHSGEDVSTKAKAPIDDGPLPAIAHIDTQSFVDFFDRFQSLNSNQGTRVDASRSTNPSARNLANPAVSARQPPSAMLKAQTESRVTSTTQPSSNLVVGRNDSTGSSSTTLSMRSTHLSPMTRNSSTSSFTEPPSPVAKRHSPRRRSRSLNGMDRSRSPLASAPAVPQNLDTRAPAIQMGRDADRLHQERAELESTESTNARSRCREASQRPRSISLPRAAECGSIEKVAELPSTPHQGSRGAKLGSAMAQARYMLRPRSLFIVNELDRRPRSAKGQEPMLAEQRSMSTRSTATRKLGANLISASAAESIIYRIMYHLTEVKDLQSAALVSKGFMNTFKRNETTLVSHLIYQASKPAWELRRNILLLRKMKDLRLKEYLWDLQTIKGLKVLILDRCRSVLNPQAIAGLNGDDRRCETEVENALWRIWSFCVLFGGQSHEPLAGLHWLSGGKAVGGKTGGAGSARLNDEGLNPDELDNVLGMWICLQSMMSKFHGRQDEADRAGVFGNWCPELGWTREEHLQEWTAYLLALGPQMVLLLCSGGLFDCAKSLGLTNWPLPPPGQTRSNFLTSTISHIYGERVRREAAANAALTKVERIRRTLPPPSPSTDSSVSGRQKSLRLDTSMTQHRHSSASVRHRHLSPTVPHRHLSASIPYRHSSASVPHRHVSASVPHRHLSASVPHRHLSASAPSQHSSASVPYTAPVEIRPDCDPELERQSPNGNSSFFPATASNDPTLFHKLTATTTTASAKLGATLFPVNYASQALRMPLAAGPPTNPGQSTLDVVDPVDQHLSLLVHQLGFGEASAKRALAKSDTGSGIDVRQAIELLLIESRQHEETAANTPIELPTPTSLPNAAAQQQKNHSDSGNLCTGDCKQTAHASKSSILRTRPVSAAGGGRTGYSNSGRNRIHSHESNVGSNDEQYNKVVGKSEAAANEDMASEIHREQLDVVSPLLSSSSMPLLSSMRCMSAGKRWHGLRRGRTGCFTNDIGEHEEAVAPRDTGKGKASASRSSHHSGGVVGMEEYEKRIERRQSQRQMMLQQQQQQPQQQPQDLQGLGISPAGVGDGLGGLRHVSQGARTSSGLWIKRRNDLHRLT